MTNSADPDQLASSEATDLDLHCLQRQRYPGSARERLSINYILFMHFHFHFRCDYILDCKGQPKPFSIEKQEQIVKTVIEPMAGDGLRTICIAYKDYNKGKLKI